MSTLFERIFQVPREDQAKALVMFCYAFVMAAAYVVGRSVADSVFLSRVGPGRLPAMYVVAAAVVSLTAVGYAWLVRRYPLLRVIALTSLLLAICCVLFRWLLFGFHHSLAVVALIYLLAEVRGALGTIQFSTLVNEMFAESRPERVFGIVGAGATFSGILFGGLVGYEAHELGTTNLLYVVAGLDLLMLAPLLHLRRSGALPSVADEEQQLADADWNQLNSGTKSGESYARSIAMMVGVEILALTVVAIQWKTAAANAFAGSERAEDAMTSYFGLYYGSIYLLTGFIQLFITGRLLHGFGLLPALLLFPSALLLSTFGLLAASGERVTLWAATLTKGSEVFRRSISDPARQLLYWPMPVLPRRQTIAYIGGIVKPVAEAGAGLGVLALTQAFTNRELSYAVILLIAIWLTLSLRCERQYEAALRLASPDDNPADSPSAPPATPLGDTGRERPGLD